jgi:hypothetical protein
MSKANEWDLLKRLCPNQGWPRHRPDTLANTRKNPAFAELSTQRIAKA